MDSQRRAHPRVRPLPLLLAEYGEGLTPVRDIGLTGAFIEEINPPGVGQDVQFLLWVNSTDAMAMRGVVRHCTLGRGMGVEFLSMGATQASWLEDYCSRAPEHSV